MDLREMHLEDDEGEADELEGEIFRCWIMQVLSDPGVKSVGKYNAVWRVEIDTPLKKLIY